MGVSAAAAAVYLLAKDKILRSFFFVCFYVFGFFFLFQRKFVSYQNDCFHLVGLF